MSVLSGGEAQISDRGDKRRGFWLTAYLLYIGFSNGWNAFRAFASYRDLVVHRAPNPPHWLFLTLGILSAIAAIAVVGIWCWKKWGLWAYVGCWMIAFGLSAFLGVPFWSYLLLLSQVALLYVLLHPRRDFFR
ncbi:hypothetical protein JW848_08750 [Candidatus Bipolaricaulota bacterium]|nr:hypothetical protein [Candidatus Bipolaricaulota bacterium]